jgi:hypothetical protein
VSLSSSAVVTDYWRPSPYFCEVTSRSTGPSASMARQQLRPHLRAIPCRAQRMLYSRIVAKPSSNFSYANIGNFHYRANIWRQGLYTARQELRDCGLSDARLNR